MNGHAANRSMNAESSFQVLRSRIQSAFLLLPTFHLFRLFFPANTGQFIPSMDALLRATTPYKVEGPGHMTMPCSSVARTTKRRSNTEQGIDSAEGDARVRMNPCHLSRTGCMAAGGRRDVNVLMYVFCERILPLRIGRFPPRSAAASRLLIASASGERARYRASD